METRKLRLRCLSAEYAGEGTVVYNFRAERGPVAMTFPGEPGEFSVGEDYAFVIGEDDED